MRGTGCGGGLGKADQMREGGLEVCSAHEDHMTEMVPDSMNSGALTTHTHTVSDPRGDQRPDG